MFCPGEYVVPQFSFLSIFHFGKIKERPTIELGHNFGIVEHQHAKIKDGCRNFTSVDL